MNVKICSRCHQEEPILDFCKNNRSSDGYSYQCKACRQMWRHNYYTTNRKWEFDRQKKYRLEHLEKCRKRDNSYNLKKRRLLKKRLVEEMGGKCVVCGYDRYFGALDFHHLDASKKDFNIANLIRTFGSKAFDAARKEATKCLLVCCRCHRELHGGVISYPT